MATKPMANITAIEIQRTCSTLAKPSWSNKKAVDVEASEVVERDCHRDHHEQRQHQW